MKPNVLFIFADQMRGDSMGCAGHPLVRTPNLDAIAERGVMFTNAYTPCPICVPARATVTTGNYPHKCTGHKSNSGKIKDGEIKIAEHFSRNGYVSYASGKLHYSPYAKPDEPRLVHGFDHVTFAESGRILAQFDKKGELRGLEDYHDYLREVDWGGYDRAHGIGNNDIHPAASPLPQEHCVDSWVCTQAIGYLEDHKKNHAEKPFFMFMSFPKPHAPYDPPVPFNTMYDPREVPQPFQQVDDLPRSPGKHREKVTHGWDLFSPEMHRVARAHYYGLISFQDKQIGRMLAYLLNNNLVKDTIIVYSADHGDMVGDFGFFAKSCFYKGSAQVPLLISYPRKLPARIKFDALVGLQDILPTLVSLADVPLPPGRTIDGVDLSPIMEGKSSKTRDYYIAYNNDAPDQSYMIATKHHKYIYSQLNATEEFYDLREDPDELDNRIHSPNHGEIISALKHQMIQWSQANGDGGLVENGGLKTTMEPVLDGVKFEKNVMGWRWY